MQIEQNKPSEDFINQHPKYITKLKKHIVQIKSFELLQEVEDISSLSSSEENNKSNQKQQQKQQQQQQLQQDNAAQIEIQEQKFKNYITTLMQSEVKEGVIHHKNNVSENLKNQLMKLIDQVKDEQEIKDYHPGSNGMVRDIVHQSMFAFHQRQSQKEIVNDEKFYINTKTTNQEYGNGGDEEKKVTIKADFWGRGFTGSNTYQWLPTNVTWNKNQNKCTYDGYINNLPRKYENLYHELENLLALFMPNFQQLCEEYISKVKFSDWNTKKKFDQIPVATFKEEKIDLKNFQVITKIVDYEMKPGQEYDGVWHVEGMSHENILATGVYFIKIDENIKGGELSYKRNFSLQEREVLGEFEDSVIDEFTKPLGKLQTCEGDMIIFPNSHMHKLHKIVNQSVQKDPKIRRIVAFFLINPYTKIISTSSVPEQQGTISYENAGEWRDEMMNERKYVKIRLNKGEEKTVERKVNYCEH